MARTRSVISTGVSVLLDGNESFSPLLGTQNFTLDPPISTTRTLIIVSRPRPRTILTDSNADSSVAYVLGVLKISAVAKLQQKPSSDRPRIGPFRHAESQHPALAKLMKDAR